ncbi:MAG TPA: zinc-dependent alcohol dehydrogenase family protein [Trueperaceae bacterium]|nr:zinc-dependent alcohol dehydrogenase family protein [Trueperaceae bacterium]
MRAAQYRAYGGPLAITDVPDPQPGPDGAVVEVRATGVCRSDWHAWMGHDPSVRPPHVPGHEFAGVVTALGPQVRSHALGERVTAPFCCGCGRCEACRGGHQNLCHHEYQPGFDGPGSFAALVFVPHADVNLVRLPEGLGFTEAASLGCRFMTSFAALVDKAALAPGETLAVFGCGGVGLSAVMIASALGARVIAVDIDTRKLQRARELGAHDAVDAGAADPVEAIRDLTGGGAHVSIDAVGTPATAAQGVRSLRRRGRHVQAGLLLADDAHPAMPMLDVIKRELVVSGVHGMASSRYPELLAFVASARLEVSRLIGRRVGLEDAGAELAAMGSFAQQGLSVIERF